LLSQQSSTKVTLNLPMHQHQVQKLRPAAAYTPAAANGPATQLISIHVATTAVFSPTDGHRKLLMLLLRPAQVRWLLLALQHQLCQQWQGWPEESSSQLQDTHINTVEKQQKTCQ
jgi:hypothetical protein